MTMHTPTRDDIHDALEALARAEGQLRAALRVKEPAPEVLRCYWLRAAGAVRVLHCEQRRRGASEEGQWGHE